MPNTRIHAVRHAAAELSDEAIERLMNFGKREADLIDQLEDAVRTGDRALAWQLAEALVRCQDEAHQPPPAT